MVVVRAVRDHVREAADEAAAHERSERQAFGCSTTWRWRGTSSSAALLPTRTPHVPGFDIAGMNRPADQTGGDYYDWQPLPDGRLGGRARRRVGARHRPGDGDGRLPRLRPRHGPHDARPGGAVARLNELLHDDLPSDRFITFALAVLDDRRRTPSCSPPATARPCSTAPPTGDVDAIRRRRHAAGRQPRRRVRPDRVASRSTAATCWSCSPTASSNGPAPPTASRSASPRLHDALRQRRAATPPRSSVRSTRPVPPLLRGSPQSDDMTAIVVSRMVPAAEPSAEAPARSAGQSEMVPMERGAGAGGNLTPYRQIRTRSPHRLAQPRARQTATKPS